MPGARIGLDHPAFAGRLRIQRRRSTYERRAVTPSRRLVSDFKLPGSRATAAIPKPSLISKPKHSIKRIAPKPLPPRQTRSTVLKRQLVGPQKPNKRRSRPNVRSLALMSLAVLLFLFGLGVGVSQLLANKEVEAQAKALSKQSEAASEEDNSGLPSEKRPHGNIGNYKVAPGSPRVINIQKLGVKARVLRMGVKANNEIKTPNNIYDTGWFEGSARPGELGAVFINGHVHGPKIPGVFAGLKQLKVGDKITIERGDGKVFSYSVVRTKIYDKNKVDMGAAFNSIVPGKPGLNLMTCSGQYSVDGGYDKRVMVFAVQN